MDLLPEVICEIGWIVILFIPRHVFHTYMYPLFKYFCFSFALWGIYTLFRGDVLKLINKETSFSATSFNDVRRVVKRILERASSGEIEISQRQLKCLRSFYRCLTYGIIIALLFYIKAMSVIILTSWG